MLTPERRKKIAIACQGGGSHSAFTAGVLKTFLEKDVHKHYQIVGISGTSGGGICATAAWYGLLKTAQGDSKPPYYWLEKFWQANSANLPWEKYLNTSILQYSTLLEKGLLPIVSTSPYQSQWLIDWLAVVAPRREYVDFRALLEQWINFSEIPKLVGLTSPRLLLGAVDILSGNFKVFDSRQGEIQVQSLLASAAFPSLFKAVEIGDAAYWDGLFSQNPPIRQLLEEEIDRRPEEIWIVQIEPKTRPNIPTNVADIDDRRIELAGNLSLYQEVHFIEVVNQWFEKGFFKPEVAENFKPIKIRWLEISEALVGTLDVKSKKNRDWSFISQLMSDGEVQAIAFLQKIAAEVPV